jgi:FSR family fosmidomycin resistance protein-like MFS transporter
VTLGTGALAAVVAAHFVVDLYGGYTAPLLRHFHETFHLSRAQTAALTLPSSLVVIFQPLLGLVSDRMRTRAFVVGGLILGTVGYGLALPLAGMAGASSGYWIALLAIWVGAIGLAAYHPQGAALSGRAPSERWGGAVAVFTFTGSLGYGLGILVPPIFFPEHIPWITVLTALGLAALVAQRAVPRLRPEAEALDLPRPTEVLGQLLRQIRPCWGVLLIFWLLVVLRAATLMSFQQFTSIYYGEVHKVTPLGGAALVSGFFLVQALAGLASPRAAARMGSRAVLVLSFLSGGAILAAALGAAHGGYLAVSYILLILGGAAMGWSIPLNIAAGQKLLPGSAALGSGIMIGFGWGTGGLLTPLAGKVADSFGSTEAGLLFAALLAIPAALLALLVPRGGLGNARPA